MLANVISLLISAVLAGPVSFQDPNPQNPNQDEEVTIPEGAVEEQDDYIVLKFGETEEGALSVKEFIKVCQIYTDREFTLHETTANTQQNLSKPILLYGEKRIKRSDFYSFFQTMMKINGFVCVPHGSGDLEVIVITPVNATTQQTIKAGAIFVDEDKVEEFADQPGVWIATVVKLEYAQAQGLGTNLRTALGAGQGNQDSFMPLPTENALLIQSYGPFVAAAVRLVHRLDVEPARPQPVFEKITLEEASAEELSELLSDLIEDETATGSGNRNTGRNRGGEAAVSLDEQIETRITAWPRDNSLLVTASAENMERVKELISKLDTVLDSPETKFRVYQLQNIDADELSQDLRDFLQRTQQAEEQALRGSGASGAQQRQAEQRVVVVGQEETNSLLITATRGRWAQLQDLLDTLDQRQPQVLIETALIEVSEDFTKDIGFEYANVDPPNAEATKGFGFTSVGLSTLIDTDNDNLPDTRVPNTSQTGFTAGILDGADFGLPFLLALAQDSNNTNVLSIPSILVTNNRKATVEAIDEIPVTEQTPVQNVGITETFAEYQEAGIKLEITPSISAKRYLRLDLNLEISAFRGAFSGGTIPPPRVTRNLTTTVYLPDGATMWIGGIIRDDMAVDETGIPWLSDIPVFGWIFGRTTDSNVKTTLFFFCTPRIMDDFDELADISTTGKGRAADVIGLDRLRRIDPSFRFEDPLDVILDEDLNGDGELETGMLDLTSFGAPAFVSSNGVIDPNQVGADTSRFDSGRILFDNRTDTAPTPDNRRTAARSDRRAGRNLPEGRR